MAPTYISGLITIKSKSNYSLRSNNELLLEHPRVHTNKTLWDQAFCVATPKLWNVLPDTLREITLVDSFKAHLKPNLFRDAFKDFIWSQIYFQYCVVVTQIDIPYNCFNNLPILYIYIYIFNFIHYFLPQIVNF